MTISPPPIPSQMLCIFLTIFSQVCYNTSMRTFSNIEEYIELIAGFRDPVTGRMNSNWIFGSEPAISLARYDTDVINNMAVAVSGNTALTTRQAELACKIILKYRRQLNKLGVDVDPVETPVYRMPLRQMDYTKRVQRTGDNILIHFPYSTELIDEIRKFSRDSQGKVRWDAQAKNWEAQITEYNVSWIYTWAQTNQFEISAEVCELFQKIQESEQTPYPIELTLVDDQLTVTNSTDSLQEYVSTHLGGWGIDNVLRLIDQSSTLGYGVNPDLASAIKLEYGDRFYSLLTNREIKINSDDLDAVLDYADQTQRWPVVIFEPDLFGAMLTKLSARYPAELIGTNYQPDLPITEQTRYIHTIKGLRGVDRIPILITAAGMIFGGDRQLMIQRAEKIVYSAQAVYTKGHTDKKVKSIAG